MCPSTALALLLRGGNSVRRCWLSFSLQNFNVRVWRPVTKTKAPAVYGAISQGGKPRYFHISLNPCPKLTEGRPKKTTLVARNSYGVGKGKSFLFTFTLFALPAFPVLQSQGPDISMVCSLHGLCVHMQSGVCLCIGTYV